MSFFSELLQLERQRNVELHWILDAIDEASVELTLMRHEGARQTAALNRIADAVERIAGLTGDDGVVAGIAIGPSLEDPADRQGGTPMGLVAVIPDNKMTLVDLVFPLVTEGGNELKDADGLPWQAPGWNVTSDDPSVIGVTPNDGSEPNFPPAATGFWLRGKGLGQATAHVNIPLPDGSTKVIDILGNVVASEFGAQSISLGEPVADPNPTS